MKPIVPELLKQATPENIQHAALELLLNPSQKLCSRCAGLWGKWE